MLNNRQTSRTVSSKILPIYITKRDANGKTLNTKKIHFQINTGNTYDINYKFFMPKGFHLAHNVIPNVTCRLENGDLTVHSVTFIYIKNRDSKRSEHAVKPLPVHYVDADSGRDVKSGMVYGSKGHQVNVVNRIPLPSGYVLQDHQSTVFKMGGNIHEARILLKRKVPAQHFHNAKPMNIPSSDGDHQVVSLNYDRIRNFKLSLDKYNHELEDTLLNKLFACNFNLLKRIMIHLFSNFGYQNAHNLQNNARYHEISGVIRKNPRTVNLIDAAYVMIKRYSSNHLITINEIRDFVTNVMDHNASKGIFITTSAFNPDARQEASRHSITLIDGHKLAHLMVQNGIGVKIRHIYKIISLDDNFFN